FLITADHGGHDLTHGTNSPEDMTIPWIAAGPGIKRGYEIKRPVSLIDTAATVLRAVGTTDYYVEWTSKSVDEIFETGPASSAPAGKPHGPGCRGNHGGMHGRRDIDAAVHRVHARER